MYVCIPLVYLCVVVYACRYYQIRIVRWNALKKSNKTFDISNLYGCWRLSNQLLFGSSIQLNSIRSLQILTVSHVAQTSPFLTISLPRVLFICLNLPKGTMLGGLLAGVCYIPLMGVSIEVKQTYKPMYWVGITLLLVVGGG